MNCALKSMKIPVGLLASSKYPRDKFSQAVSIPGMMRANRRTSALLSADVIDPAVAVQGRKLQRQILVTCSVVFLSFLIRAMYVAMFVFLQALGRTMMQSATLSAKVQIRSAACATTLLRTCLYGFCTRLSFISHFRLSAIP